MSTSIVLDIDLSCSLAENYLVHLRKSTSELWIEGGFSPEITRKFKLANSLLYYNQKNFLGKDLFSTCSLLAELESERKELLFDGHSLEKLATSGVIFPQESKPELGPIDYARISQSISLISNVWPAGYQEFIRYMAGIIIIDDKITRSMSSPLWFGAIFIGNDFLQKASIVDISTSLVHEVGHMALFAQSAVESPLTDLEKGVYSPFVGKVRPSLMVLHAQIAMARMIIWLFSLKNALRANSEIDETLKLIDSLEVERNIEKYSKCYLEGMTQIRILDLSDTGRVICNDFEKIENLLSMKAT